MIKKLRILTQIIFLGIFLYLMMQGENVKWLLIFLISLPVALLLGRVFCGWICPINTLMIPIDFFAKKSGLKRREVPTWLKSGAGKGTMLFILLFLLVSRPLFGLHLNMLIYVTIAGILTTLWFKPEVWHNYICPFGLLESMMGRFARFSNRVDTDICTGCKLCLKVCSSCSLRINAETKKAQIEAKTCLQCFDCQERCPKNAIPYGLGA